MSGLTADVNRISAEHMLSSSHMNVITVLAYVFSVVTLAECSCVHSCSFQVQVPAHLVP